MSYDIRLIPVRTIALCTWLTRAHYEEVSSKERILSVDWCRYQALEAADKLFALAACEDGEPVGYSVNLVDRTIHYELVSCYNSALFVHPDYRVTPLGLRLMAETKRAAAERGATLMLWHAKPGSQLDKLLTRKRLKVQDIVYQEQLPPARADRSPYP